MVLPHEVLGVAANADGATINAAFRRAAKRWHPDLNNGDTSGLQRLRRLIAAREFLTSRKWYAASARQARFLLPSFRKKRITRSVVLTFAAAAACAIMLLPVLTPGEAKDNPRGISVVQKTGMVRIARGADANVPDAGSGEIKAIRVLREQQFSIWHGIEFP
jgi:hypothetical protein